MSPQPASKRLVQLICLELAEAEQRLVEGATRINHWRRFIEQLQSSGSSTDMAEGRLARLLDAQALLQQNRDRLREELEAALTE